MKYHLKLKEVKNHLDYYTDKISGDFELCVSKSIFKTIKPFLNKDNKYKNAKLWTV